MMKIKHHVYFMKFLIVNSTIILSFLIISNSTNAQEQDIHLSNFLNYFTKEYLPSDGLYKINDKVRPTTFLKRNKVIVYGLELVLNRLDTTSIGLNKVEQSQLLTCLKNYTLDLNFNNFLADSLLINIDSIYYYDSLIQYHESYFYKNYLKYNRLIEDKKYDQVPDSILNYYFFKETLVKNNIELIYLLEKDMVEITTPYFFKNYSQCVIAYVRHLFHKDDSKVLLFRKENEKWGLQKVLYDNLLTLDDED